MAMPPGGQPPQGAAPAPAQPPQGGQPPQSGGAAQIVSQIHDGIAKLKPLVGGADPQMKQAYAGLDSAFQAFIAEASKPSGPPQGAPAPQGPSPQAPPMPAHAGPGSQPMPPGR